MNYRHIYHAGNFADIVKHFIMILILQKLCEKETAFSVIDTHAGIGLYDLTSKEALKTGESQRGIIKLLSSTQDKSIFKPYLEILQQQNPNFYPGSPIIARAFLRKQDRLWLSELHDEDYKILNQLFNQDHQVKVLHQDGYISLKSLLPPREKRGLILIDPPFENRDELKTLVKGLQQAYRRFATGIYMIWFPIKSMKLIKAFYSDLKELNIPKILAIEFLCQRPLTDKLLNGTGVIIINPPWKIEEKVLSALEQLLTLLDFQEGYTWCEWLSEEKLAS